MRSALCYYCFCIYTIKRSTCDRNYTKLTYIWSSYFPALIESYSASLQSIHNIHEPPPWPQTRYTVGYWLVLSQLVSASNILTQIEVYKILRAPHSWRALVDWALVTFTAWQTRGVSWSPPRRHNGMDATEWKTMHTIAMLSNGDLMKW